VPVLPARHAYTHVTATTCCFSQLYLILTAPAVPFTSCCSNHLDAATIEVLTGALQEFTGAIVAITHNKAFAESLCESCCLWPLSGQAQQS
jgi:hypothetical protein